MPRKNAIAKIMQQGQDYGDREPQSAAALQLFRVLIRLYQFFVIYPAEVSILEVSHFDANHGIEVVSLTFSTITD